MAFMRILSPKSAPPVLRFEGSTEIIANRLLLKSIKKRRTNSSTKDDLPAPPVPVIPNTGVFDWSANFLIVINSSLDSSGKFSAAEINLDIFCTLDKSSIQFLTSLPVAKSDF